MLRDAGMVWAFAIGLGASVLLQVGLRNQPYVSSGTDYVATYEPIASNLVAGNGYSRNGETTSTVVPPGFPVFLASCFVVADALAVERVVVVRAALGLCFALSCALIYLLARTACGTIESLAAVGIFVCNPLLLFLLRHPMSEIAFLPVLLLTVLVYHRCLRPQATWRCLLACGALAGVGMLIRPFVIGLGVVLAVCWPFLAGVWRRKRAWLALVLVAGNLCALLPWQAWISTKVGRFVFLSEAGPCAIRDGLVFGVHLKRYRGQLDLPGDTIALMQRIFADYDSLDSAGAVGRVVLREAAMDPVAVGKLYAIKAMRCWYGTDSNRREGAVCWIMLLHGGAILVGAAVCWHRGQSKRQLVLACLIPLVYSWAMATATLSIVRYLVPALSVLCACVGPALVREKAVES